MSGNGPAAVVLTASPHRQDITNHLSVRIGSLAHTIVLDWRVRLPERSPSGSLGQ